MGLQRQRLLHGKIVPYTTNSTSVTLNVPPGTTYDIVVGYRATVGSGAWSVLGASAGTFTVTSVAPAPVITVTAPPAGGSYAQGFSLPVTWTTDAPTPTGEFVVWAYSGSGFYIGQIVPSSTNSTSVTLNVPPGTTYQIVVGYRPTVGSGGWNQVGASAGTFTVN